MYIKRFISFILAIFLCYLNINTINTSSSSNCLNNKFNILILNSYNPQNQWEQLVLDNISSNLSQYPDLNISIEYLDSKTSSSPKYNDSFSDLLDIKYGNTFFNLVLTLDDEAFTFARERVILEGSIFYKTPVFFIGVNNEVTLNSDERMYISGVIELEDNLKFINLITTLQPDVHTIYVLLDESTFSSVIRDNILTIQSLTNFPINIVFLKDDYIDNILPKLPDNNSKRDAIILIGEFQEKATNLYIPLDETVNIIKKNSKIPIYSKIEPYIYSGAIGGIIDLASYHGTVASNVAKKILAGTNITDIPLVYNSLDVTMFNYDALNYYNINPLLLPKETIIINKSTFDLLLPKPIKYAIWSTFIICILFLVNLIYLFIKQRKEVKEKESELKKIIETDKLKSTFIATMSHEFRTPINIILSTSQLLTLKIDNNNIDLEYFKNKMKYIVRNSNRLLKLVNNIIDVSRLESGYLPLNNTYTNIVEVVENTVTSIIEYANSFNIEVVFDTEYEEIYTYFDINKIERCILNLLSNSIKFTPAGGKISIIISSDNSKVYIKIIDTGVGISKESLTHIFDRFYQTENTFSRISEGSGLGLFIVKGLITLHKGTINVESTPGVGSTFVITLPIISSDDENISEGIYNEDISRQVSIELSDLIDKN